MNTPVSIFGTNTIKLARVGDLYIVTTYTDQDGINTVSWTPDEDLKFIRYEYQIRAAAGNKWCWFSGNMTFPGLTVRTYVDTGIVSDVSPAVYAHKVIPQDYMIPAGTQWQWTFNIASGGGLVHQYLTDVKTEVNPPRRECSTLAELLGVCNNER